MQYQKGIRTFLSDEISPFVPLFEKIIPQYFVFSGMDYPNNENYCFKFGP